MADVKWRAKYRTDPGAGEGWFTLDEMRDGRLSIAADFGQNEEACELAARAMNAHEGLVAACKRLMECGCAGGSDFGEMVWDAAVAQAEAAILAAGGPAAGAGA